MKDRIAAEAAAIPLRVTLVLALVVLAAAGLLASGVAVTSSLRTVLVDRLDQQLDEAAHTWANPNRPVLPRPPDPSEADQPPVRFYARLSDSSGRVVNIDDNEAGAPDVPADPGTGPFTTGSVDGSSNWRVLYTERPQGSSLVALRMDETEAIIERLIVLELVIGALVLAAIAVAAYFVIRRSLRRLVEVEEIAAEIAAGDLHRRVPVRGTDTEVDSLAASLNAMLTQIQTGFAATEASEEAARRSEANMRRFVADASHELRTPLTTIRGFAELYRQGAVTDAGLFMERIESESNRMSVLVADLLMLARLDAQRPLERDPVDLLALASDAVHSARATSAARHPQSPPRHIDLEARPGTGTYEIPGDDTRLRQVLANLLNNALVHTPPDAAITVALTPLADEVLLEVSDTGPGLPAEEAARIFERFYRTDTSRSRDSGGTGLGLSIVQALVTAHGGTVDVHSTVGSGTTFTVHLPREHPRPEPIEPPQA
ncbi:sensor histidine kinase [Nocardia cyriacigeorgica]|uniref:sensor histidine kinase n=1 Tax=Nocardia cyriacigeorgica TaxID=135487 RepID=UPI0024552050|nr:HAMP domain-containing sensor histidine kinase [Nocardia cyriacigeorgica]